MGKSASKLKKKRSQSVFWSFRFPSMMSIHRMKMPRATSSSVTTTTPLTVSRPVTPTSTITNTGTVLDIIPTAIVPTTDNNGTITTSTINGCHTVISNVSGNGTTIHIKPHLDVHQWLTALDLTQYDEQFSRFTGVEELLHYSEADVKELGIKNSAHRARIVSSLLALKIKYEKGLRKLKNNSLQRHSVAVEKRGLVKNSTDDLLNKCVTEANQSKSLCTLIMEPTVDSNLDPSALKKALEWELSLDTRDLCSHAWYHGAIPRPRAEEIIEKDGEFLVRDCTSQPGNYVLSCRHKGQALHFVINKVVIQPDTVYERVQYQFEDDGYDTVPDLITYYVGSGKPISAASGARIQYPRNRMYPLSFYASKYPTPYPQSRLTSPVSTPNAQNPNTLRYTPYNTNSYNVNKQSSPSRNAQEIRPRLPAKKQRSQSLTPAEAQQRSCQEKCNSADGVIQSPLMTRSTGTESITANSKFSTHSLPRNSCTKISLPPNSVATMGNRSNNKHISRVTSDPSLSPCVERKQLVEFNNGDENEDNIPKSPPPKPSRIPSLLRNDSKDSTEVDGRISANSNDLVFHPHGSIQRVASYHASGSDSGNGSGDSAQSSTAGDSIENTHRISGVVIKNPRYTISNSESSITLKNFDYASAEAAILQTNIAVDATSKFDIENFQTLLLPATENKPLDATALQSIKIMLRENQPRILANHLTKVDLQLALNTYSENRLFQMSGIELISLPHGHQLRIDIIERTVCLKLLVAVTILTCTSDTERAEILNKWIEVAIDTKTALGNLFGFCGVMLGLCTPQIQSLESTWHMLRQKHTDSAFNFEAKLRPTLKSMNECTNPQAPNTTIPHLLPIALLQERGMDDFIVDLQSDKNPLITTCLSSWETKSSDFGLSTMFAHLETARKFSENIPMFKRNAEIILNDASRIDELMLDAFRTEFHLKFLWGSRGAHVTPSERHTKFEQVLKVLAEKYSESAQQQIGTNV